MSKLGILKKIGKIAAVAAPFVAAPFTGGASLALIGAGSGAAGGLLNGGGVKGALLGGALGAATSGIGGGKVAGKGSILGKIGGSVLGNGGKLGKIINAAGIASEVAPVLGGMAAGRAQSRQQGEVTQLGRDRVNIDRAQAADRSIMDRAGVDLQRRNFQLQAPGERLNTGVRGSMVANAHPITVGQGGPMTLSSGRSISPIHFGGLDASMINGDARDLGSMVTKQMLADQTAGDKFSPLAPTQFPGATAAPEEGFTDKLIGGGATAAGILGALNPALRRAMAGRRTQPVGIGDMVRPENGDLA